MIHACCFRKPHQLAVPAHLQSIMTDADTDRQQVLGGQHGVADSICSCCRADVRYDINLGQIYIQAYVQPAMQGMINDIT